MSIKLTLPKIPIKQPSVKVIHSPTIASVGPDGGLDIRTRDSKENIHHPRRLTDIPDGRHPQKGSSSAGTSQLPRDSGDRTSKSSTEESPAVILQNLMNRFIFLKENGGKAEAFKELQKSFAANAAVLSPYFIPLKDLMNLIMELETFIGRSGEHVGKTPEQVIRGFLATGFVGDNKVNSPYEKVVDKST